MNRILILTTAVIVGVPIAFSLLIFGYDKANSSFYYVVALAIMIASVVSWWEALKLSKKEDNKREQQMQDLIEELRGFRDDFRNR